MSHDTVIFSQGITTTIPIQIKKAYSHISIRSTRSDNRKEKSFRTWFNAEIEGEENVVGAEIGEWWRNLEAAADQPEAFQIAAATRVRVLGERIRRHMAVKWYEQPKLDLGKFMKRQRQFPKLDLSFEKFEEEEEGKTDERDIWDSREGFTGEHGWDEKFVVVLARCINFSSVLFFPFFSLFSFNWILWREFCLYFSSIWPNKIVEGNFPPCKYFGNFFIFWVLPLLLYIWL